MTDYESQNIFVFKQRSYPLFCPYCNMNVNLSLDKYKLHLENYPDTCLYCENKWELKEDTWIEKELPNTTYDRIKSYQ